MLATVELTMRHLLDGTLSADARLTSRAVRNIGAENVTTDIV